MRSRFSKLEFRAWGFKDLDASGVAWGFSVWRLGMQGSGSLFEFEGFGASFSSEAQGMMNAMRGKHHGGFGVASRIWIRVLNSCIQALGVRSMGLNLGRQERRLGDKDLRCGQQVLTA